MGEQQPAPPQEVQQQQAPVQSVNNCAVDQQNFIQCLNANQGSVDACQFLFRLFECMPKRTKWFCLNVLNSFREQNSNLVTTLGKGKTRTKKSMDIGQDI